MPDYWGLHLKDNLKAGLPSRMKSIGDYQGYPIEPCGSYAMTGNKLFSPPWIAPLLSQIKANGTLSLHQEIKLCVAYMQSTKSETIIRQDLIDRFSKTIASFKLGYTVRPVGSCVTGLHLPTSDIDMVVIDRSKTPMFTSKLILSQILLHLRPSGFASDIQSVFEASVPLLRIKDKITGLEIDLTASDDHGIQATEAVKQWTANKSDFEVIKAIVLIVKVFLSIRRCGTTYTGGINSYVLVWMVVAWYKLEVPKLANGVGASVDALSAAMGRLSVASRNDAGGGSSGGQRDFGQLLTSFFKFYGEDFDYETRAIRISPTPYYTSKVIPYSRYTTQRYLLSIFDPAGDTDIGAKAYAIKHIQKSFMEAHRVLSTLEAQRRAGTSTTKSILNRVLLGDFEKYKARRAEIVNSRQSLLRV